MTNGRIARTLERTLSCWADPTRAPNKHFRPLVAATPMSGTALALHSSAPNPKFAHSMRQVRSRTSGSKGALEIIELLVVLRFRSSYLSVLRVLTNFGIGPLVTKISAQEASCCSHTRQF